MNAIAMRCSWFSIDAAGSIPWEIIFLFVGIASESDGTHSRRANSRACITARLDGGCARKCWPSKSAQDGVTKGSEHCLRPKLEWKKMHDSQARNQWIAVRSVQSILPIVLPGPIPSLSCSFCHCSKIPLLPPG
eukprot:6019765-Pleurochrysis_carterae.AAC.1